MLFKDKKAVNLEELSRQAAAAEQAAAEQAAAAERAAAAAAAAREAAEKAAAAKKAAEEEAARAAAEQAAKEAAEKAAAEQAAKEAAEKAAAEQAAREAAEKAAAEQAAKEAAEKAAAEKAAAEQVTAAAAEKAAEDEKEFWDGAAAEHERDYIVFDDVRKTYRMGETEINALDGVNFTINKGELVIIVGASGAGKSTILNILGGMDTLSSGTVMVDGKNISEFSNKDMIFYRRYDVGFVFQFYNLVQNLTARENVELACQVSQNPLDIDETMDAVGLESRKANFPSQLSGGEQQRVAIARALAKNPKLLLCDEPTGALDYNTGKAILQVLQDTAHNTGMTVIIITHNFALTSIGDRVITVKSGKVASIETNDHPMDIRDVEW